MNKEILVETVAVSKNYADGNVSALTKVSVAINKGEFFVIRGPSGSGKSTLLHIMGGIDSPSSGEVMFCGQNLKELSKQRSFRVNNMGFVFQAFYLWSTLNVIENIFLPLMELRLGKREKLDRCNELIDLVGLSHRRFASIRGLSMGERQRVTIARALVTRPLAIMADEPTGSLDSKNTQNVLELFKKVNIDRGVTIIMVTHEKRIEEFADRGIELLDGKLLTEFKG